MQPLIYQTPTGYDIRTHNGNLYSLVKGGAKFIIKPCGKVGEQWRGTGTRLKAIPNQIKSIFFTLNQKSDNTTGQ